MITFKDQVILIIYFLIFGMFLAILYDILHFYLKKYKINLIIGYAIQFIFWLGLVYLACIYMLKISYGYLTIYTFGFFLLGVLIHIYFFSKGFSEDLTQFDNWLIKIFHKLKKVIIVIVFPKEVFYVIGKIIPKKRHFLKLGKKINKLVRKIKFRIKIKIRLMISKHNNRIINRRNKHEKNISNSYINNRISDYE